MKKKILSIIFFSIFFFVNSAYSKNSIELYEKIDLFGEVLEKIRDEFVDEVDQADVMESAINGVLSLTI